MTEQSLKVSGSNTWDVDLGTWRMRFVEEEQISNTC